MPFRFACVLACLGAAGVGLAAGSATAWLGVSDLDRWPGTPPTPGRRAQITIEKDFRAPIEFDDLVVSWSARARDGAWFEIFIQGNVGERATAWYSLGRWSERDSLRTSVAGQKDADGEVQTDTLLFSRPIRDFRVRIVSHVGEGDAFTAIGRLDFSFVNSKQARPKGAENRRAWGMQLPVPKRPQGQYANGGVLCSPTSTSMLLAYWGQVLNQPFLAPEVPEVQSRVFDPAWGGTGNWIFNTAYAASRGMRAYVTRLNNLGELEAWIAAGFPVATSVSYDLLKGKGKRGANDGHLVVLSGFTAAGDPVFNDPGRSDQIRHTYRRVDFDAAWSASGRAVYLIYPPDRSAPRIHGAPWGP